MARIPTALWRPIPENAYQPSIVPTQWIVHTAVDGPGPTNLGGYFERADIKLESHTWLRWDRHEQLMDSTVRADANYLANRRPDGTGAFSTETEDDGKPVQRPWNAYQLSELIRTGVFLHFEHGIPAEIPKHHAAPGMGWHCLFPKHWTNVPGKTCPGPTRIAQFKSIVLPGIQARIAAVPAAPEPTPALSPMEHTMILLHVPKTNRIYFDNGRKVIDITDKPDDFWALAGDGKVPVAHVSEAFVTTVR